MKLKIVYFPPFDSLAGRLSEEVEIEGSSIIISDLLLFLVERHPQLNTYISLNTDEELRTQMSVIGDLGLLRLTDTIEGEKLHEIKILPPIAGGSNKM